MTRGGEKSYKHWAELKVEGTQMQKTRIKVIMDFWITNAKTIARVLWKRGCDPPIASRAKLSFMCGLNRKTFPYTQGLWKGIALCPFMKIKLCVRPSTFKIHHWPLGRSRQRGPNALPHIVVKGSEMKSLSLISIPDSHTSFQPL